MTTGAEPTRAEYTGFTASEQTNLMNACASAMGTYSATACTRTDAVGGYQQNVSGDTMTTWFYASGGETTATVQMACASTGSTYVAP